MWTKLGFLPLLLVGLLPAAAAQAAVVPVVASGVAETGEDETACYEAAVRDALMKAIGQTMEGMPGAEKAQVDLPALARDRSIVKSVKLREKAKNILGQCEVSLRTVLDKGRLRDFVEGRLSTSLDLQSNRLSAIGAVMRFLVDSKVAEDAGFDTKEALTALGQALRNYNVRLVNLDPVATVFARQEIPQWQAVTGDGMAEGTVKGDSAQAAQFVREAVHQALHMSLGEFDQVELQSFDLLLTGQSDVRYLGPDPQGPGHIAEVSSYLELVAVNGLATVATTTSTGRQKGPSREAAIRRAMIDSLEGNAAALAAQIDKALRDLRKYGRAYNVVVTNITSNRKQLRPLIAGLQAGGATLVEGRSDGDGISKFNIAYRGEISALESLLGRVLDDMARDFPSVDYRINGNVIEVSF